MSVISWKSLVLDSSAYMVQQGRYKRSGGKLTFEVRLSPQALKHHACSTVVDSIRVKQCCEYPIRGFMYHTIPSSLSLSGNLFVIQVIDTRCAYYTNYFFLLFLNFLLFMIYYIEYSDVFYRLASTGLILNKATS